jgi:hypothetical protein
MKIQDPGSTNVRTSQFQLMSEVLSRLGIGRLMLLWLLESGVWCLVVENQILPK